MQGTTMVYSGNSRATSQVKPCKYGPTMTASNSSMRRRNSSINRAEVDQFPGQRPATRAELYRRLHRGRDFLSASYVEPVSVAMAANAAHLSPYHFHRMF